MKKNIGWVILVVGIFFLISYVTFSFAAEKDTKVITQGEFATMLGKRLDLKVDNKTPAGYSIKLEQIGVAPAKGWRLEQPLRKEDVADTLVGAGRLKAEVLSGKDTASALKERGIILPKDIDRNAVDNLLKDPNVNRLLETPTLAGPSIPYPQEGITVVTKETPLPPEKIELPQPAAEEPPTEPPTTEPPTTEPATIEQPRPSGGGSQ